MHYVHSKHAALKQMKMQYYTILYYTKGTWLRGPVVERQSLDGMLSLSCARPAADRPLMWVNHPLQASQLGQLSLSSFRDR